MKLNLQLRKDGIVYYNNDALRLQNISSSVASKDGMEPFNRDAFRNFLRLLLPECQFEWLMPNNEEDERILVLSGTNRYNDEVRGDWFLDGWKSLEGWSEGLQKLVDSIRTWYKSLPEEEKTVEIEIN